MICILILIDTLNIYTFTQLQLMYGVNILGIYLGQHDKFVCMHTDDSCYGLFYLVRDDSL